MFHLICLDFYVVNINYFNGPIAFFKTTFKIFEHFKKEWQKLQCNLFTGITLSPYEKDDKFEQEKYR